MSDEIEVGLVANDVEATLVVNLLLEKGIAARSDASSTGPLFGGASFDAGHRILVPVESARKAREILEHYPNFKPRDASADS